MNSTTRYIFYFLPLLFIHTFFSQAQSNTPQLRKIENNAFQRGEKITYRVFYNSFLTGNVHAGEASLEIMPKNEVIAGRNTMNIVGLARTKGVFNFFFRVMNRYETYLDENAIAPMLFIRRIQEGSYRKIEDVMFNHYENIAKSNTATVPVVPYVQDFISAFYYLRTYDYSSAQIGDVFDISFFLDDSVYVSRVIFDGREEISTRLGTFNTLKFKPQVLTGEVFSHSYPMTLWISDDKNKLPILVQLGIIVGSIKMELYNYKGLKNPLTSKIR